VTGSRSGSLAMLTANPTQLICGKAQKAPGQDDQGLIMGGCGGSLTSHQRSAGPCAGANGPPLNRLDDRLGLGRGKGAMGQILAFPSRQRGVEPPVDEVADLYESNLVAHVVGYLQRVEDRVGSAVVERLAVRLMVAMCYQLGDRVVDELINELEAMQHA